MKKTILILLLFIPLSLTATKYYVAPSGGSDSNAGTNIAAPWATWQYAITNTPASDTCYFLDGTWYPTSVITFNAHSGTHDAPTCFFAYTDATPICDFNNATGTYGLSVGYSTFPSYIYMKGLQVCHLTGSGNIMFFVNRAGGYLKFENMTIHHGGGQGFYTENCDTVYYINCDAYEFCDSVATDPGGWGTGFTVHNNSLQVADMVDSYTSYKGCRAWRCSDQGWGGGSDGTVIWDSCWALANGFHWGDFEILQGTNYGYNGNGAKWEEAWAFPTDKVTRIIQNCIFAFNEYMGITQNNYLSNGSSRCRIQNNFVYSNGYDHFNAVNPTVKYNFDFYTAEAPFNEWDRYFSNNISYKAGREPAYSSDGDRRRVTAENESEFISQTNYWNSNTSVTDADFITLDSTGMCGPRQADGTLPYTQFGHLAPGSDLIDAGTDVGLPYTGTAPDVGWVESTGEVDETATDILTFVLSAQTGVATINTTLHTVSIEVEYGSDVANLQPTITISYGATIDPASGVYRDFTSPVTYTVTAQDAVTTQEWTVTVTVDEAPVVAATVTTTAISNILTVTATGGGNITNDGNGAIIQYGVCWNTVTNPTTANSHTSEGAGAEGAFSSAMTGLTFNTHYYVRAYATNSAGTSYGSNVEFTTLDAVAPPISTMGTMLKVKGANKFVSKKTTNTLLKKKN